MSRPLIPVSLTNGHQLVHGDLGLDERGRDCILKLDSVEVVANAKGADWFLAQTALRLQLETKGFLLCCQGARPNCVVSPMQAEMARAWSGHLVTLGRRATRRQQVEIFAAAPCHVVSTVAEQERFRRAWFESLDGDWKPLEQFRRLFRRS